MQDIYIDDIGEGYPLIFVHGFLGSSEMWKFQKDYFKSKFRIIAPALPGFGESYKANSPNDINSMAKFILSCAEQKNIKNKSKNEIKMGRHLGINVCWFWVEFGRQMGNSSQDRSKRHRKNDEKLKGNKITKKSQ